MLIALKMKAVMFGAAVAAPLLATTFSPSAPRQAPDGAVAVASGSFGYRVAGDFSRDGKPAASPLREIRIPGGLVVMKNQVTAAEYAHCMADRACPRVALPSGSQDVPIVGVSW
ncbi:MAG: formylglycine-generating enzyme family protein, partial [Reyranella sp.]